MLKKIVILTLLLLTFYNSFAESSLRNGMLQSDANRYLFSDIYLKLGGMPISIFNISDDTYFGLWGDGRGISKYLLGDVAGSLGKWRLYRWNQELKDEKVKAMYTLASEPDFAISYNYKPSANISKNDPVLGCLAHNPLRYGDLEQNGRNELALFLGFESQVLDIVLFSPEKEKIIFSVRSIFTDSTDFDYGKRFPYQYASNFNISKGYYPGTKTYAKIFVGEFDGNKDNPDIIVWRKHYTSLSSDSIEKGFKLDSENYQFYTLKNDEYHLEIAPEIQMQTWLKDNNLTWQKGFPSKSECKGEEGKLIPEMHDPLLNDPDVLK